MPLICVCSPKGGVGKTTISANLTYTFARAGHKVLAIDFDVQNALRLHFGIPLSDGRGFVAKALESSDWSQHVLSVSRTVFVLPYGDSSKTERENYEHRLVHDRLFVARGLNTLLNYPGLVVIADFPAGPNPALRAISSMADLYLIPLLADTASLSLISQVEHPDFLSDVDNHQRTPHYFLINQVNSLRNVNREVTSFMTEKLGEKLLGTIHFDESVVEAHSSQQSVFDFNSNSAAAFDIEIVSNRVASLLSIEIGDGTLHRSPAPTDY